MPPVSMTWLQNRLAEVRVCASRANGNECIRNGCQSENRIKHDGNERPLLLTCLSLPTAPKHKN